MNAITQQCLDAHNEYRRRHGAPPLVISNSLMRMAQNWAQTNANKCRMYHSSNRGNVGENLYATSGRLTNGRDPVTSWYNEIKYYRFGSGGFSMATGHFTQVVWKSCTQLGVGWATGRNGWTFFCCNYAPAGNYQGQFAANVLPLRTPQASKTSVGMRRADNDSEEDAPAEDEEAPEDEAPEDEALAEEAQVLVPPAEPPAEEEEAPEEEAPEEETSAVEEEAPEEDAPEEEAPVAAEEEDE